MMLTPEISTPAFLQFSHGIRKLSWEEEPRDDHTALCTMLKVKPLVVGTDWKYRYQLTRAKCKTTQVIISQDKGKSFF